MENASEDEGLRWLSVYLANTITKTYECVLPSNQHVNYREEMSEIKLCPAAAVQFIQLCKTDDARQRWHKYKFSHFFICESVFVPRVDSIRPFKTCSPSTASLK